jgi:hypothetical protein
MCLAYRIPTTLPKSVYIRARYVLADNKDPWGSATARLHCEAQEIGHFWLGNLEGRFYLDSNVIEDVLSHRALDIHSKAAGHCFAS